MTFTEIVDIVCDDLNLTTAEAIARVGRHVNRRYRRVAKSIGLALVLRRVEVPYAVVTDTRIQTVTGVTKVVAVINADIPDSLPLDEITYEEMKERIPNTSAPHAWAVKRMGASSVTLYFDTTFADATNLTIVAEEGGSDLSGSQIPAFDEDYHDILVYGAKADELRKKEKIQLARDAEAEYERMLGEFRLQVAVSGYRDVVQGKLSPSCGPARSSGGSGGSGGGSSSFDCCGLMVYVDDPAYGAAGDGVHDDTVAFEAAIAAVPPEGGTVVFDGSKHYLINLTINRRKIRLMGTGGVGRVSSASDPSGLSPYDITLPVLQLGNATQLNEGVELENIELNGLGTGHYGLKLTGGSSTQFFNNITISNFTKKCLWIASGADGNTGCAFLFFSGLAIQPSTSANEHGIYIEQTNTNSYVEAIFFNNVRVSGVGFGYAVQIAGSHNTHWTNSWFQVSNNHGVLLSKPFSVNSRLIGSGLFIDSDTGTDTLMSVPFSTGASDIIGNYVIGLVGLDGKVDLNGTLRVNQSQMHLPDLSASVELKNYGSLFLVDAADPNSQNCRVYGETVAGRTNVRATGDVLAIPGSGIFVNSSGALATAIDRITNSTGNHDTYAVGANMFVKPSTGGYFHIETNTIKAGLTPLTLTIESGTGHWQFANSVLVGNNTAFKSFALDGTTRLTVGSYNTSNNMFLGQTATGTFSSLTAPTTCYIQPGAAASAEFHADYFRPTVDSGVAGDLDLGDAAHRWKEVFAANGTINTSDEREKRDIESIDDAVLDAWADVDFVAYRWKNSVEQKGDSARVHFGIIAQRVRDVFTKHGLDPAHYALLCYDKWEESAQLESVDENGERWYYVPAGDRYGIRYTEALALEAALQRRTTQRLQAQLDALTKKAK